MRDSDEIEKNISFIERRKGRLTLWVLVLFAVLTAVSGVVDRPGLGYLEQSLQRTLVTFGIARALNGVISVAQGTEVAIEPAGVGINFAPGQILDPVNDMIERFSWVMLSASSSIGLQRLTLELFEWRPITLLYALFGAILIGVTAVHRYTSKGVRRFFLRLFLLFTVTRFLIPALAIAGEGIHRGFLEPRYETAMTSLERSKEQVGEINAQEQGIEGKKSGLAGTLRNLYSSAQSGFGIEERLARYRSVADEITTASVELIVIFLFQTIFLPLMTVWFFSYLFRAATRLMQ